MIYYFQLKLYFIPVLLQSSVDLEPRDRNRKAPLDLAAKHGHEDIIKFLESEKFTRASTRLNFIQSIYFI